MQNVGIRYGQGPEILSDVKLSLKKGSFHFLTGKSGAGKTSLLSMMYLAQKPSRGIVNVFGKNVNFTNRDSLSMLRRKIGQQHAVRAEGKPRAGAHKARSAGPQIVKFRLGHGARSFRCRHIDRGDMQLAYRLIRLRCSPSGT